MILQHRVSSDFLKPNFAELYRYAGITEISGADETTKKLAEDAASQVHSLMNCRSVYLKLPLTIENELITFGDKQIQSHSLSLNLKDCSEVILFAATLGPEVDKAIQKASKINAAKSVMLQAAGAMFIEEYCDCLQDFLKAEEGSVELRPRFSPGYGDVSLEVQKIFFELLQCQKNLALTLNDSLIMSPEKSVTAFIGLKKI